MTGVASENLTIAGAGGRQIPAALALPAKTPAAGVIVIHEAFGLNRDIREKAERMAEMGYVAVAPDLLSGRGPKPLCIMRVMRDLANPSAPAWSDLEAARAFLAGHPAVDGSRLGVIGFCMGGGFALLFGARAPVGAAAVFYGAVPKDTSQLDGVCPVVGGFGGLDRVFGKQAARLEQAVEERGVAHDIRVYPGAGHSYMSDHHGLMAKLNSWGPMKLGFDSAAAEDSWRRVEAFFAAHLGGN